jgi:Na+-translocating ferredoxin:NAD+ oxidoreductase RnfC subunit
MAIEQTAEPQPINNPELPSGAIASLERHAGKGEGRFHVELGSRIVNGRIAMKANTVTAVVMNETRKKFGVDMDMDVTFAPGPAN